MTEAPTQTAETLQRVSAVSSSAGAAPVQTLAHEVAVLVLIDVRPGAIPWGWMRFVLGCRPLRHLPGLKFSRQLGSGYEGGFGLRPSGTRQGLFLVFENETHADDFVHASPVMAGYRRHARELCCLKLRAYGSRGSWGGTSLSVAADVPAGGPMAALTRASIRPSRALRFWRLAPPAQDALATAAGCRLAVGLGEAPLLRQATFSVWDSVSAMNDYARSGAHLEAIRISQREGYFSESMFVRFVVLSISGQWMGREHG
jgi:hypothetical protein